MRCPKCGYHSFESLNRCKKCQVDLGEHKARYRIKGFFSTSYPESAPEAQAEVLVVSESPNKENEEKERSLSLKNEHPPGTPEGDVQTDTLAPRSDPWVTIEESEAGISLDRDDAINLDQPFDIDSEKIPADSFGRDET